MGVTKETKPLGFRRDLGPSFFLSFTVLLQNFHISIINILRQGGKYLVFFNASDGVKPSSKKEN